MSEWLDIMLEEIERKTREAEEAQAEAARRSDAQLKPDRQSPVKSGGARRSRYICPAEACSFDQ